LENWKLNIVLHLKQMGCIDKNEWNSLMIMTSGGDKPLDFATTV
jgi:hypothetical protein